MARVRPSAAPSHSFAASDSVTLMRCFLVAAAGVLSFTLACQDKPPGTTAGHAQASIPVPLVPSQTAGAIASAGAVGSAAAPAAISKPSTIIAQHILIAFRGAKRAPKGISRSKADARARADEVVTKVNAGEDFTALVKTYSDDPGSAERQGSVGKFAPADMDPAFSAAAFGLTVAPHPGCTSSPVETPFGYHVIRRTQ